MDGILSEKTLKRARQIFKGMVMLAKNEGAQAVDAVATAALREAKNAPSFIAQVKDKLGLDIRVISGEEEAFYIFQAVNNYLTPYQYPLALIDIGGGSTEITLAQDGHIILSRSFPIGTLRILKANTQKGTHDLLEKYEKGINDLFSNAKPMLKNLSQLRMVGTGGNLRRFGKLRPLFFNNQDSSVVSSIELKSMQMELLKYTAKELQKKYDLKRDRSETIRPAMSLAMMAMENFGVKRLELPNVGLADGVILQHSFKD
jgi:exopolyphosphatase/guanosine-5'-triphosphate,3'-diphosphate pyrophosphatase